jgi:regulator of replication initiation timing
MWMGFGPDDNDAMVNLFPVETVETMAGMYDDVMEARDWLRMTLGRMCDAHHETANELQYIINALTARNEELTARNEELTAENEELTAENEEMREEGRKLVDELAIKTEQLDEEIFWREENGRELGYDYHSPYWEGAYWDGLPCSHFEEQGNDGDDNGGEDDEEYKHDEEYGDSGNSVTMMMKIVVDIMLRALWRKSSELLRLMCESFLNKLEKDERQVSFIEE